MKTLHHYVDNKDGWLLSLHQTWSVSRLRPHRRPVVIVPGYGMNSWIFQYHPRGLSLEGFLADAGFEVWRLDMRGQGASVRVGGRTSFSFADLALTDLGAALDAIVDRSHTTNGDGKADIIGASLGGTLMFTHAVLRRPNRLGALVCMGSPVRWVEIHPLVRVAFVSPLVAGMVSIRGTRRIAEVLVPRVLRHVPKLLSFYMNPDLVEEGALAEMVRTVENPNRGINRELARWIGRRDLSVNGVNIAEGLRGVTNPLLCLLATGDGIVPRATAAFPFHQVGTPDKKLLEVGDQQIAMAHADLFLSRDVHLQVYRPLADWLVAHADTEVARAVE
jgi:pimeloyl-ACP methyl ester carboxylesterase